MGLTPQLTGPKSTYLRCHPVLPPGTADGSETRLFATSLRTDPVQLRGLKAACLPRHPGLTSALLRGLKAACLPRHPGLTSALLRGLKAACLPRHPGLTSALLRGLKAACLPRHPGLTSALPRGLKAVCLPRHPGSDLGTAERPEGGLFATSPGTDLGTAERSEGGLFVTSPGTDLGTAERSEGGIGGQGGVVDVVTLLVLRRDNDDPLDEVEARRQWFGLRLGHRQLAELVPLQEVRRRLHLVQLVHVALDLRQEHADLKHVGGGIVEQTSKAATDAVSRSRSVSRLPAAPLKTMHWTVHCSCCFRRVFAGEMSSGDV